MADRVVPRSRLPYFAVTGQLCQLTGVRGEFFRHAASQGHGEVFRHAVRPG
ncbi:hypothetical protein [Streptomyces phaeoluteigriseus]